ncbi:MAG: SPOR domain-containing protein [Deltaproteobacteria bacterium]|nr:SPOR domain-containing protein [Deltaproteobacteria bacterium]
MPLPPNRRFALSSTSTFNLPAVVLVSALLLLLPARASYPEGKYFSIQVGAYHEEKGAKRMVADLRRLGHDAFYREETGRGGVKFYRVYIERFRSRREALREGRILKNLGLIADFTVKAPEDHAPLRASPGKDMDRVTFLHVGSFMEKENAERMVSLLVSEGVKAVWVPEIVSGKRWYRVYIGKFRNEKEARKEGEYLKKKGVIGYFKPLTIDKKVLAKDTQ